MWGANEKAYFERIANALEAIGFKVYEYQCGDRVKGTVVKAFIETPMGRLDVIYPERGEIEIWKPNGTMKYYSSLKSIAQMSAVIKQILAHYSRKE